MAEIEQENVTYKKSLDQFLGKMDIILELLRTHKENATTVVGTLAEIEIVARSIPNQSGYLPRSSGMLLSIPRGCHKNSLCKLLMVDL